jgi:hypothetical protein
MAANNYGPRLAPTAVAGDKISVAGCSKPYRGFIFAKCVAGQGSMIAPADYTDLVPDQVVTRNDAVRRVNCYGRTMVVPQLIVETHESRCVCGYQTFATVLNEASCDASSIVNGIEVNESGKIDIDNLTIRGCGTGISYTGDNATTGK